MWTRRATIDGSIETASDILSAADDRFAEAEELIAVGRFDGAVYLLGYAAEMWTKAACLRLQGLGPAAPVKSALAPIKLWMKLNAPAVAAANDHDVRFWAEFIVARRRQLQRPLAAGVAAELRLRVTLGVYEDWTVNIRYRRVGVTALEAWVTFADEWWLRQNRTQLQ